MCDLCILYILEGQLTLCGNLSLDYKKVDFFSVWWLRSIAYNAYYRSLWQHNEASNWDLLNITSLTAITGPK